ncbi:heme-copper oxidase subunit III [Demequina capsici]|uniref:cytochrome-c oxidase n=1 Tax=Demequina capsici TaxID=3075620 RepID=A0AA96JBM0_9MICO|nr:MULTISPECIES: heme-copper oxidase subunit III [unclassified Demequina]WNM25680.1 heme-copper oxidase subunit III [Demequina sp. OYTSA14]WNM28575.1 heme-copper oxidase subunit III [Demequina sp. PMTSA13]
MSHATTVPSPIHATRPNQVAVGTIVWLSSELMFFAGLFAMYFTLRAQVPDVWEQITPLLNVKFAFVNTTVLVLSSFTAQAGVWAAERYQRRRTGSIWQVKSWGMHEWFVLTYLMGSFFIAGQVYEYAGLISDGLTISSSPYGSVFYLATGFHGLHVLGGLIAMLFVLARSFAAKKFTAHEATTTIVVSYYWHFVDVVWIALFSVVYLVQ